MRRTTLLLASLVAILIGGLTVVGTASASVFTSVVKETTAFNSVDRKKASVRCPEFSERVGGGVSVDGKGSKRHVAIHNSRPIPNGWYGAAHETSDFDRRWSLTVRAVCQGINKG